MYKRILHPTDLSDNHFHMCEKAKAIADQFNAKLYLIHVIQPPASLQFAQSLGFAEFDKPTKGDAVSVMNVLGEALNIPESQQIVEVGAVYSHILNAASKHACDLIIIGSHEPSTLPSFLGSTAHAVLNHSDCDVITLRP